MFKSTQFDPHHATALNKQALLAINNNRIKEGIDLFKQAFEYSKVEGGYEFVSAVCNNLATMYLQTQKPIEAIKWYITAIEYRTDNPQFLINLDIILNEVYNSLSNSKQGAYTKSDFLELLNQAKGIITNAIAVYQAADKPSRFSKLLSSVNYNMQFLESMTKANGINTIEYHEALTILNAKLKEHPADAFATAMHKKLIALLKEKGKIVATISESGIRYSGSLSIKSKNGQTVVKSLEQFTEQELMAVKEDIWATCPSLSKDAEVLFEEGNKLITEGNFSDALHCFNKATKIDPDNPVYRYYQAEIMADMKYRKEADAVFEKALEKITCKKTPELYYKILKAKAFNLAHNQLEPHKAKEIAETLLKSHPKDQSIYFLLGRINMMLENRVESFCWYDKISEDNSLYAQAQGVSRN